MRLKILFGGVLGALCVLAGPTFGSAAPLQSARQAISSQTTPAAPTSARTLSHDDVEAWLDGYLPYALKRGDVAGAVVVVVKDGQVILQKGYGYADVVCKAPINAETTLFRPGSVSKLITWTAVMQQVEQGRIDLDRDVNTYLDFKIPPYQGRPITMRNLMTHTPGFEDSLRDLVTDDIKITPNLRDYLVDNLPPRIFKPGEVPAYSNYGVALAGYIVQRTSGVPFDDYIEQRIFQPLNMKNATFRQPLPTALAAQMSGSYDRGSAPPKPYEMFSVRPAGSAAISGADMGRFLIAHLQDGQFEGRSILQPATARMMHNTRLTTINPSLNRMALGFWEMNRNGHRILGHDGDSIWFHSVLQIFPDDHVGVFLSQNSIGQEGAARAIRQGFVEGFADRYFPAPPAERPVALATAKAHAAALAGQYESTQWMPHSFLSLINLVSQVTVTADGAGRVTASNAVEANGQQLRFEEVAPYVWREIGGQERLAAKVEGGRVVMWSADNNAPIGAFTPTPAGRDARWLLPALLASILILSASAVMWPIRAFARWRCGAPFVLTGAPARAYRWTRIAIASAALLMVAWWITVVVMGKTFAVSATIDPWILILHLLSIVIFPAASLIALGNVWVVGSTRKGWRNLGPLAWAVLLALGALTLLWVALAYRLIGLNPHF